MSGGPNLICRGCAHRSLDPVLDLGRLPLANSLQTMAELRSGDLELFPLALYFCPRCTLVQIGESVEPEKLFSHYLYASSFSESMLAHVSALVRRLIDERSLGPDNLVIEIASNDGYLLQFYKSAGIDVLGIEPAANIAAMATEQHGIPTLVEFFNADLGTRLARQGRYADVVHGHNVFAHVPDPMSFLAGLRAVMKPDGVAVIEVPYVGEFIDKLEFDTIYHEHYSYFSLTAVHRMVRQHGLTLADVERVPIHGGSLRMFIAPEETSAVSPRVHVLLEDERHKGMTEPDFYRKFAGRVWKHKAALVGLLRRLKADGRSIAAYGASAKGSTLMNAFGIGDDLIDFVADRSPLKQGRLTPGNHLPILPPNALLERGPDYALLLAWNFADEILAQQQAYRDAGGKFIIPLPELLIV